MCLPQFDAALTFDAFQRSDRHVFHRVGNGHHAWFLAVPEVVMTAGRPHDKPACDSNLRMMSPA